MSLALSLGIQVGFKRTSFMMIGELLGVGLIAVVAIYGMGALMQNNPAVFQILKWLGACYLIVIAVQSWLTSREKANLASNDGSVTRRRELISRGFITAVSNPKGWAFSASFLPAFINSNLPLLPQASVLVSIILLSELLCMCIYAGGGSALRSLLRNSQHFYLLHRISSVLLLFVALMLVLQ